MNVIDELETTRNQDGLSPVNVLEAVGVTKQFGGLTAVNSVDLVVPEGNICSIIGPNGLWRRQDHVFSIV